MVNSHSPSMQKTKHSNSWQCVLHVANRAATLERGSSVLGHYPNYVETAESLGARYFNVPKEAWAKMTPTEQWAANQRFLDRAIQRGDDFVLATPPQMARPGSFYARELNYLESRGFTLNVDGTKMLAPVR
jgi:hypothetical protein